MLAGPILTLPRSAPPKLIDLDSIGEANQIDMSLENKLQTKRRNKTVDFLRLLTSNNYYFNIEGRNRRWNHNVAFDLEAIPYDWLRFETDANLDRKKSISPPPILTLRPPVRPSPGEADTATKESPAVR